MQPQPPQPRYGHAAVGIGRKLLVWGGRSGSTKIQSTTVESLNVASETWEQPLQLRGSLPDGLYGMAVASDGEIAYLFGGSTGSAYFNNSLPDKPNDASVQGTGTSHALKCSEEEKWQRYGVLQGQAGRLRRVYGSGLD